MHCQVQKVKVENKIWGSVCHVFQSDHAAVSILNVVAGFRCSRHRHKERANMFAVISGCIEVDYWHSDLAFTEVLGAGDSFTVPSGWVHQFRVIESGQVVEVYWPDRVPKVRLDDIDRFDVGGPIEEGEQSGRT
jgi:mannose-6-phosphate isomerase-like protein (cupin superfamily)